MASDNLVEDFARIVSYCRISRNRAQIMRKMNLNDSKVEAYMGMLVQHRLLERVSEGYRTTDRGNAYLDTRGRIEVALRKKF